MKTLIRASLYTIKKFRQSFYDQRAIKSAEATAKKFGFQNLSLLGKGKDSTVFRAKRDGQDYVIKVLSAYSKKFLPVTKDFLEKCGHLSEVLDVKILDDQILYYSYLDLKSPNLNSQELLKNFTLICDFQQKIMQYGFVMWDFGFSGVNYMLDKQHLKIIDYGGNAYLYLESNPLIANAGRVNLGQARNEFLQQSLVLHFIILGIGQTTAKKWGTWIQDHEDLTESRRTLLHYVKGTLFEKLAEIVFQLDLTKRESWAILKQKIATYFEGNTVVALDKADIDQIRLENDKVTITGYQNYILTKDSLVPLDRGHEWANTKVKWGIISSQLRNIKFDSFLDIGSNLGLYVFTAKVLCHAKATGVDYNQEYIENCQRISSHLSLDCQFIATEFGKIDMRYDCVSMLGVIHHIYSRTESFGNLEQIVRKLSDLSNRYVVLEFPTENDSKAMKWIKIPSRETSQDYTLQNFLKVSEKYFSKVSLIDSTTADRPVYLLEK